MHDKKIDNNTRADVLRDMLRDHAGVLPPKAIRSVQAEIEYLDQPKTEPGTVVIRSDGVTGFVTDNDTVYFRNGSDMRWNALSTQWKPARILAQDEVAVKVQPVPTWPYYADYVELRLIYGNGTPPTELRLDYGGETPPVEYARRVITRAEAERMEAER